MTEERKKLWRKTLYAAMLEIRMLSMEMMAAGAGAEGRGSRDDCGARIAGLAKITRDISDWSHNIANFSAQDFSGFEETWALRDAEALLSPHREELRGPLERILREIAGGEFSAAG